MRLAVPHFRNEDVVAMIDVIRTKGLTKNSSEYRSTRCYSMRSSENMDEFPESPINLLVNEDRALLIFIEIFADRIPDLLATLTPMRSASLSASGQGQCTLKNTSIFYT